MMRNIHILFSLIILLGSCGVAKHGNFRKQKFTNLKRIEIKEEPNDLVIEEIQPEQFVPVSQNQSEVTSESIIDEDCECLPEDYTVPTDPIVVESSEEIAETIEPIESTPLSVTEETEDSDLTKLRKDFNLFLGIGIICLLAAFIMMIVAFKLGTTYSVLVPLLLVALLLDIAGIILMVMAIVKGKLYRNRINDGEEDSGAYGNGAPYGFGFAGIGIGALMAAVMGIVLLIAAVDILTG